MSFKIIKLPDTKGMSVTQAVKVVLTYTEGTNTKEEIGVAEIDQQSQKYRVYIGIRSFTKLRDGIELYLTKLGTDSETAVKWWPLYSCSVRGIISLSKISSDFKREHIVIANTLNEFCANLLNLPVKFSTNESGIILIHNRTNTSFNMNRNFNLAIGVEPMGLFANTATQWQQVRVRPAVQEQIQQATEENDDVRYRAEEGSFDPDKSIGDGELATLEGEE